MFKAALIGILLVLGAITLSQLFQGNTLYANLGDTCYMYTVDGGVVSRREEPGLYSNYEEADSRVAFSTSHHRINNKRS